MIKIILVSTIFTYLLSCNYVIANSCNESIKHTVNARQDGGYNLSITCTVRSFNPITAEGFFPKKTSHYKISIPGKGKDLSYKNYNGYYYSVDEISSNHTVWDIGYVWVDKNKENIYLNLYWLSPPDGIKPSEIHGKYSIEP